MSEVLDVLAAVLVLAGSVLALTAAIWEARRSGCVGTPMSAC
jgi:hypothetical protein